jgi:hypothetical protein
VVSLKLRVTRNLIAASFTVKSIMWVHEQRKLPADGSVTEDSLSSLDDASLSAGLRDRPKIDPVKPVTACTA